MSIRAVAFVADFHGLTIAERCVAFVLARYASHPDGLSWPSMTTVAEKASLKNRQTASDITARLVQKGVLTIHTLSKGGPKNPTKYQFNFGHNCNPTVAVESNGNCNPLVAVSDEEQEVPTATQNNRNCNPKPTQLQPKQGLTATPQLQEGFRRGTKKGKEKGKISRNGSANHHRQVSPNTVALLARTPIDKAKTELVKRGEDPEIVFKTLARAQIRHVQLVREGKAQQHIGSPQYWVTTFDNTPQDERDRVCLFVKCDRALHGPYSPGFVTQAIAEYAERCGIPVPEIAANLLTDTAFARAPHIVAEIRALVPNGVNAHA
jgi:hypothetical protein